AVGPLPGAALPTAMASATPAGVAAGTGAAASSFPGGRLSGPTPRPSAATPRASGSVPAARGGGAVQADHLGASTFIEKGWHQISAGDATGAEASLQRALKLAP